ncbi:MAG: histidine phosphatase family protein [Anaerolineae bacterium]
MIYLTRHGESVWNKDHRYQGNAPIGLSEAGREHAELLADALSDAGITTIYASPTQRCVETAGIIADRLGVPVEYDPRLREWEISENLWGETSLRDKVSSDDWERLRANYDFSLPAGESLNAVIQRTLEGFDEISHVEGRKPLIVTHQINVQLILAQASIGLPDPPKLFPAINRLWIDYCSISILGEKYNYARVLRMNDVCHLNGYLK